MTVAAVSTPSATYTPQAEVFAWIEGRQERVVFDANGKSGNPVADLAYRNALEAQQTLYDKFGQKGWDNTGKPLKLVVHYEEMPGQPMNNAFWDTKAGAMFLGDGDGKTLSPLGNGLDVIAHELAHGIIDTNVNLKYRGEPGGLHESWADILAVSVDDDNWQIGEDVYTPGIPGDALRDLSKPRYANYTTMPKSGEVHEISSVPSFAAYKVAQQIGKDEMGKIWYNALTTHMPDQADFQGAAQATYQAAVDLYGNDHKHTQAVLDAWKAVGLSDFKLVA